MSPKNKKGKKLTSTIMALAMTVTTTFQMPIISMASEIESSVAVESQIEEGTSEESVSVQSETTAQTNAEQTNSVIEETSGTTEATNDATQVSDEVQATVAETTAEVTYEEEKTTLSSGGDPLAGSCFSGQCGSRSGSRHSFPSEAGTYCGDGR